MAVNPRLFELLAEARARPRGAFADLQSALGATGQVIEGVKEGQDIKENIRKRRLQQSSLRDVLGGRTIPGVPSQLSDLPIETIGALGPIAKFSEDQPKQPSSLDAILADRVNKGQLTTEQAFKIKNKGLLLRAGFEEETDETGEPTLRPVVGGKPAREIAETAEKKRLTAEKRKEDAETALRSIDDALEGIGFLSTGFVGSLTSGVGGTPAANLDATLNTVRSLIGFDTLQTLRAASPTGGALGPVSDRENTLLQSVRGSLEQKQSPEQLKKTLQEIKKRYQNVLLINESQTSDEEANAAIATIVSAEIPFEEKRARIQGIRQTLGR
ncbi:MAG: hypothetical protein MN733_29945 [Nitrososphaera sp.]|nr:hypothetical protein [Nitrososphaera sp.]